VNAAAMFPVEIIPQRIINGLPGDIGGREGFGIRIYIGNNGPCDIYQIVMVCFSLLEPESIHKSRMATLPTLEAIQASPHSSPHSPLAVALEILFEHSPILVNLLEPQLNAVLKLSSPLTSYTELIDASLSEIAKWDLKDQSEFISGHPRIGETKNLSKLSASEQGAQSVNPTPPEVLARLAHLNACYEVVYPGLRYITFVNGRTRAAITEEMESALGFVHSTDLSEPVIDTMVSKEVGSEEWISELNRAVYDVGRIAKSRLRALGST